MNWCRSVLGMPPVPKNERGFGLAEIIIAAGIASVVLLSLVKGLSDSSKSVRKIASSLDAVTIKARLTDSVSCRETFRPFGVPPNPCTVGAYVALKSENGGDLVPAGGGRMGDWTVRARCAAGGLDIRAAKLTASASAAAMDFSGAYVASNFVGDEMGGDNRNVPGRALRYDWDHPKGRLFAGGGNGLCADWFVAPAGPTAVNCPAGQYMKGVDFMLRTPVCEAVPVCTGTNALIFDGTVFRCSSDIISRVTPLETRVATLESTVAPMATTVNAMTRALSGSGSTTNVGGSNESDCGDTGRMQCPRGFVAIGYRAWVTSSNITSCNVRCLKIAP